MLYFAYGSFLNMENLLKHCPSASFLYRAALPNFDIQFNYYSNTYQAGVTGAEFVPGKISYGVIYDIPAKEMEDLDVVESVPEGEYYRQTVIVVKEDGEMIEAEIYRTSNPEGPFKSNRKYVNHMLKGAREHGLNPEYLTQLEALFNSLPE